MFSWACRALALLEAGWWGPAVLARDLRPFAEVDGRKTVAAV
jgi:hypothetical protein